MKNLGSLAPGSTQAPSSIQLPIRLALVCDYAEEQWASMDLVGEMVLDHLRRGHAGAVGRRGSARAVPGGLGRLPCCAAWRRVQRRPAGQPAAGLSPGSLPGLFVGPVRPVSPGRS